MYNKAKKIIAENEANENVQILRATTLMLNKVVEVEDYLTELGLDFKLQWDGWFKKIQIALVQGNDSAYLKSHVKIYPNGVIEYCCGHYSVNGWSINEVLTEYLDISKINELEGLIMKDIINSEKFA